MEGKSTYMWVINLKPRILKRETEGMNEVSEGQQVNVKRKKRKKDQMEGKSTYFWVINLSQGSSSETDGMNAGSKGQQENVKRNGLKKLYTKRKERKEIYLKSTYLCV